MPIPILLLIAVNLSTLHAQTAATKWYAKVDIEGKEQHYLVDIRDKEGTYYGIIDDLTNANFRLPLDSVYYDEGQMLHIRQDWFDLTFEGQVFALGQFIYGTFQIGDVQSPGKLTRRPQAKRTQIIAKRIGYTEEDIYFYNSDTTRFSGTLSLPDGNEPCPVVVLISGSGPQDRNSEILGHKPFAVLADHLASRGVAVLRYDDRGYGRSEGLFRPATSMDYADDAQGAVNFLKQYQGRDFTHIGLIGHSEGGNIAPVIASKDSDIDFMVLLAAPGVSNYEHYMTSLDLILRDYPETYERDYPLFGFAYRAMATTESPEKLEVDLREIFTALSEQMTEEELSPYGSPENFIETQVGQHTAKWYHHYLQFDVTPYLKQLKIPVLALNGDLDRSVESLQNLSGIEYTLKQAGNDRVTTVELENVNHFFQVSQDDRIENVYFNEETFSREALEIISDWIDKLDK